jgi:hypothetical protein
MSDKATRILLVCANPRGTDPLRTAEEDRTLRESLQLSPNRDHFEVETLNAATIDDLRRALLRKPFDVVHFSGHGTQTGLVFEDTNADPPAGLDVCDIRRLRHLHFSTIPATRPGKLIVPHSSALAELLARRRVKIALLNACYSLSVGKITAIGLEYTIASTGPISDPGAIEFTRGFYDAIGAGTNVPDAYEEGLSAAKLKGFHLDAVLLKHGEEYVPTPQPQSSAPSAGEYRGPDAIAPSNGLSDSPSFDLPAGLEPAVIHRAEQELTLYVGPIAKILVREAAMKARTPTDLYQLLAVAIPVEGEQKGFLRRGVAAALPSPRFQDTESVLRPSQLEKIGHELTDHFGPVAKLLINQALHEASDQADFYERLADHLPDDAERAAFLRRRSAEQATAKH